MLIYENIVPNIFNVNSSKNSNRINNRKQRKNNSQPKNNNRDSTITRRCA